MPTQAEVAGHLDLSVQRLRELRQQIGLRIDDFDAARIGYIRWLREKAAGRSGGDEGEGLTYERTRLFRAQADKTELEAKELRGEMVRADDVIETWSRKAGAMRSRLLSLPSKAAPRARAAASDEQAAKLIEAEVIEALEELSGDGLPDRTRARRTRDEGGAEAAATTDGESVGRRVPATVAGKRRRTRKVED